MRRDSSESYREVQQAKVKNELGREVREHLLVGLNFFLESLILAQDERWRHA